MLPSGEFLTLFFGRVVSRRVECWKGLTLSSVSPISFLTRIPKPHLKRGTTISINSLFHTLPVRQKQFSKDYKKHFAQAQTLLQAYGLISKNLNLIVSNQPAKGLASQVPTQNSLLYMILMAEKLGLIWNQRTDDGPYPSDLNFFSPKAFQFQTQPNTNLRQNFANIFTAKASQSVMDFELDLCVSPDKVVLKTLVNPSEDHLDHTTSVRLFPTFFPNVCMPV